MHKCTCLTHVHACTACVEVRDLLVKKKEKMVMMLKTLCAKVPKKMMQVRICAGSVCVVGWAGGEDGDDA